MTKFRNVCVDPDWLHLTHMLACRSAQNDCPIQMGVGGGSPDGMFDNKLVNQSCMCRTASFCVVWVEGFFFFFFPVQERQVFL